MCLVRRQKEYQTFVFLIKEDVSFGHYKMRLYMKQRIGVETQRVFRSEMPMRRSSATHRSEVKSTLTEGDGQMLTVLVSCRGHGVVSEWLENWGILKIWHHYNRMLA